MQTFNEMNRQTAPKIKQLAKLAEKSDFISPKLYEKHDVKRGLRDINGNGVVCGLTEISEIVSAVKDAKGEKHPCPGELYYRGVNIKDLVNGFITEDRFGFLETAYLLLFGKLPCAQELDEFNTLVTGYRTLPKNFVRDIVMKAPSADMMNMLSRCVLSMYSYDEHPDSIDISNVLRQSLQLIEQFPMMCVYSYNAHKYYNSDSSLFIHKPRTDLSFAENLLHMLRDDSQYTHTEAKLLDLCLVLHAEHGGGNNSSFTTHVVTSSGTDTYSSVAASLGSLKGPRHGGANIMVVNMFDDLKKNVRDYSDGSIRDYLCKLVDKEAYDKSGLIYGMGHAVYSVSDPRAEILKAFAEKLAIEKGMQEEFELYRTVERLAPEIIADRRKIYKGVSANVDFFSGLVYTMLNLPRAIYTPIFAVSRIVGWSAHRIEELANNGKIIRPGYTNVMPRRPFVPLNERK